MKKLILLLLFVFSSINAQFNPAQFYNYGKRTNIVPPLLDSYPSAKAAFSLRKVRTTYSGNCIRVRRSSDDTEQDIGFKIDGTLDDSALLSFVGANDGFVTKWYDQSGNALDAYQTVNADQPRIVLSGVIYEIDSHYSILFSQSESRFLYITLFSFTNISIFDAVHALSDNNSRSLSCTVTGNVDYANNQKCFVFAKKTLISPNRAINATTSDGTYQNNNVLFTYIVGTTFASLYKNSTLLATDASIISKICSPDEMAIGIDLGALNYLNGYEKELIIYDSDKSSDRTGIETNIKAYYNL